MSSRIASFLLGTSLLTLRALADDGDTIDSTDTDAISNDCSCFMVNSSDGQTGPSFYNNYVFMDFRSLGDSVDVPVLITASEDSGSEGVTNSFFNSDLFTNTWQIQNWTQTASPNDSDVSMYGNVNSPQNIFIDRDSADGSTFLTLRTSRPTEDFQSSAEMDSSFTVHYASLRVRARMSGDAGAVAGLFYYRNDTSESDIEILTRDATDTYRASNQPDVDDDGNEVPGASTTQALAHTADWTAWNDYRLDWIPELSLWAVNGYRSANKTYGVPRGDATVNLNMWGNGGSWSGLMDVGAQARLDIAWVEIVYNATGDEGACGDGAQFCSVDARGKEEGTLVLGMQAAEDQGDQPAEGNGGDDGSGDDQSRAGRVGVWVGLGVGVFLAVLGLTGL